MGGDFYDVISLDETRTVFPVGNVSNHGVPAAILMAQTGTLIRVIAERRASPAQAIGEVSKYMLRGNQAGMFVTVLFAVFDGQKGELSYVRGGHELPMIFDSSHQTSELG